MNKKRFISLLLSAAMTMMLLWGCGASADQQAAAGTETPALQSAGETGGQQAAPDRFSAYPADLRFTQYAELELPQEEPDAELIGPDPAATEGTILPSEAIGTDPAETLVPGESTGEDSHESALPHATAGTEPSETKAPDEGLGLGDGDAPDQITLKPDPFGKLPDITIFDLEHVSNITVYRYEDEELSDELTTYHIQVEVAFMTESAVIQGVSLDNGDVVWDDHAYEALGLEKDQQSAQTLLDTIAGVLRGEIHWSACAADGNYARDLRLTRAISMEMGVLYSDEKCSMFQLQCYDENGALTNIMQMTEERVVAMVDSGVWPMEWTDSAGCQPQMEAAADAQRQEQIADYQKKLSDLQNQVDRYKKIIWILVAAAVIVMAAGIMLQQKQRGNTRRAKADATENAAAGIAVRAVGAVHNIGKRSGQQDSFDVVNCAAGTMAVVADGMGGLSDGDKVSRKIVSTMCADAAQIRPGNTDNVLCQMVAHANQEVNRMLGAARQYKSGSTLLAVLVEKGYMQWITVGDSRIYLYRGGSLIQINREHIYKAELLGQAINGKTTFSNAVRDPQADRLSSFIGMGELKHVDICLERIKLQQGDRILLMSDGVFNTLSNAEIAGVIRGSADAADAARNMEQRVLHKGAPNQDNFTCVILEI